ncbi:phosphotransferase [Leptolyngbya sp. 15MV]|nr:phosphotransferase [Leptolyngbya sp. 15MV]
MGTPPRTIHDRNGDAFRLIDDKAVALIEFLPGVSVDRPSSAQAHAVGAALAAMHLAARDFPLNRPNALDPAASLATLAACGREALATIDPALPEMLETAERISGAWPTGLAASICHTDLFPDNVLMLGNRVSGMIDFYFACSEAMAYDLAVTHAAWSFDRMGERFDPGVGHALIAGYESVRPLDDGERAALPLLAQGACLRFVASRAEDWLDTPADALVSRKDPMDFARRLRFYARSGHSPFASGA